MFCAFLVCVCTCWHAHVASLNVQIEQDMALLIKASISDPRVTVKPELWTGLWTGYYITMTSSLI